MGARRELWAALLLLAGLAIAPTARAQQAAENASVSDAARANVDNLIRQSGAEVAVAFRSLNGNQGLFIQASKEFPATDQWVEIPIMIELYARVQAQTLQWSDTVVLENNFRSAVDGSIYHLDPKRDHDAEFYKEIGRHVTLLDLNRRMTMHNSQLAANTLIQTLGISEINQRLAELRAGEVQLRHGFQDARAEASGLRNITTARGMMEVLWALAMNTAISSKASKEMVGLLANSRTATRGPFAGELTSGSADGNHQAALIVYGAHSFAAAIVVHGLEQGPATKLIGKISHALSRAD